MNIEHRSESRHLTCTKCIESLVGLRAIITALLNMGKASDHKSQFTYILKLNQECWIVKQHPWENTFQLVNYNNMIIPNSADVKFTNTLL